MATKTPRLRSEISFAAVPTAVACSRMFVRSTLQAWRLKDLADDAELIASELVTNAVKATGVLDAGPTTYVTLTNLALITLRVVLSTGLIVEVWDRDTTAPVVGSVEDLDESGRGLFIVESLSRRWNFYRPEGGGKWVWAEVEIKPKPRPLPKRTRAWVPPPAKPVDIVRDPAFIGRVLDGLRGL